MASVTITIPNSSWSQNSNMTSWNPPNNEHISLGTTLSVDGATALFLGSFKFPRTLTNNFTLALSDGQGGTEDNPQPEFSNQMEMFGTIHCVTSDSTELTITGISDSTEPYNWIPSNVADVITFGDHIWGLTDRSLTVTINDESSTELMLSDLETGGREFEAMALLQASSDALPVPSDLYIDPDRGGTDSPLAGELGLGTTQTLISRIRRQLNDNLETLTLNDSDNPEALSIGTYFESGGEGDDLSMTIQTADGVVDLPPSAYRRGGSSFAHWTLNVEAQALVDSIDDGDRFIIALWRAGVVRVRLSGSVSSGILSTYAAIKVTLPPSSRLSGSASSGVLSTIAAIRIALPISVRLSGNANSGALIARGSIRVKDPTVDPNVEIIVQRMLEYLPPWYRDSKVLADIYRVIVPELIVLYNFVETQSSRSEDELQIYLDNEIGWGYDRLINQAFIISANHTLDEFRKIYNVQTDFDNYIDLRSRLLFVSLLRDLANYQSFVDELSIIGGTISIVEDFANYTLSVNISSPNDKFIEIIADRLNKIRPAHLGGTIRFSPFTIDDGVTIDDGRTIDGATTFNFS